MKERTKNFVSSTEYRLNSTKVLLDGGQFLDTVFNCQQAIGRGEAQRVYKETEELLKWLKQKLS